MQNKKYILFSYLSVQKKYHEICVEARHCALYAISFMVDLQRILRWPAPWGSWCCSIIKYMKMPMWHHEQGGQGSSLISWKNICASYLAAWVIKRQNDHRILPSRRKRNEVYVLCICDHPERLVSQISQNIACTLRYLQLNSGG